MLENTLELNRTYDLPFSVVKVPYFQDLQRLKFRLRAAEILYLGGREQDAQGFYTNSYLLKLNLISSGSAYSTAMIAEQRKVKCDTLLNFTMYFSKVDH